MKRLLGLAAACWMGAVALACTGPQGAMGKPGETGAEGDGGTVTPSVSAVTPAYAFLGRTVDLTIAGNGTNWSSTTTVAFANTGVKVNTVTAASVTGLLVNVTISATATLGATDVTVTDGATMEVYKGAFEIKSPLAVTTEPAAGVQQGGLANIHVQMLDLTTPFDANSTTASLSSSDLTATAESVTDYTIDVTVEADVLAKTGPVQLQITTGSTVDSQTFPIVARAPTTLSTTTTATGMITTEIDTALYEFTPSSASQQFVQFTLSSQAGQVSGTVIPKSGAYADALSTGFGIRYGQGTTSTDPFYVVVGDYTDAFGDVGPVPADESVVTFAAACTAVNETPESASVNNDDPTPGSAQAVTPPTLVSGTLGYGSVDPASDTDCYSFTVTGTSKTIHMATGGDPLDDAVLEITAPDMSTADSDDLDYQEDLVYSATAAGTYYVCITASSEAFQATDNTYQLFIEVK
jgi:hypothetical protein